MITLDTLESDKNPIGGIYEGYPSGWVGWDGIDGAVTLDGDFTPDELRAIIEFVEKNRGCDR